MTKIEELYEYHIKPLPLADRLRLVELIARDAAETGGGTPPPRRNIMELHGLGAEIWRGVDAQQYVDDLRKEWGHRP